MPRLATCIAALSATRSRGCGSALLLGRNRAASACMDLSDGLADGVRQIAEASGVGADHRRRRAADRPGARGAGSTRAGATPSTRRWPAATTTSCCSPSARARGGRLRAVGAARRRAAHAHRRLHRATARSSLRRRDGPRREPLPRGLRPLPMIHLTRGARPPLARGAAAHRRHAGAHGGRVRARRVLRVLAVSRVAHASSASSFAFLLNLNRVAVLLGVYSNLPWIIAPYYAVADDGRRAILPARSLPPGSASGSATLFELSLSRREFWQRLVTLLEAAALAVHGRLDCSAPCSSPRSPTAWRSRSSPAAARIAQTSSQTR